MLRLILVLAVLGLVSAVTPFARADEATTQKPKTDVSAPAEPDDEDADTGKADMEDETEDTDVEEQPADDSESDD